MTPEQQTGLLHHTRPDGINFYKALDLSHETLQAWKTHMFIDLDQETDGLKFIFEMRHLKSVPIRALRVATEIQLHRSNSPTYSVVLVASEKVAKLVNGFARLSPRNSTRVMTDEAEAVRWLNEMVPPNS